jgi:hypothetical protein
MMSRTKDGSFEFGAFQKEVNPSPETASLRSTLQDQAKEIKRLKADVGSKADLWQYITEVIQEVVVPVKPASLITLNHPKTAIKECAGLILSDLHADSPVNRKRVHDYESYDFLACCHRAERLIETTVSHCIDNLPNYNFETMYVFIDGDLITGEINNAKIHSEWRNMLTSMIKTGSLIGMMVNDLARVFPKVVCVCTSGNHGRFARKVDWKAPLENWDFGTVKFAEAMTRDNKNIQWVIPDAWSAICNILGWNFVVQHGHQIKQNSFSIPYYGIDRKTQCLTALAAVKNQVNHYYIQAHRHRGATIGHTTGEVLMNGAFVATDEYAFEELAAYSEPSQLLFGIHEKYGVSWRLPVRLRKDDWINTERELPSRYIIE